MFRRLYRDENADGGGTVFVGRWCTLGMKLHLDAVLLRHDRFPTRDHYPFNLSVLQRTKHIPFDTSVTLFAGENGTGKSTLLEAIARACGIHIWRSEGGARYRYNPYEERLHQCLEVSRPDPSVPGAFFGSETFRDFTRTLDNWAAADPGQLKYFGGESLVTQSHGQSMMAYFRSRYGIRGVYLLDEPETALSPRSQLELLEILKENTKKGHAQFIIATHSPLLLACPGARIVSFDHVPVREVKYEETEPYRVYKDFLSDREKYL